MERETVVVLIWCIMTVIGICGGLLNIIGAGGFLILVALATFFSVLAIVMDFPNKKKRME